MGTFGANSGLFSSAIRWCRMKYNVPFNPKKGLKFQYFPVVSRREGILECPLLSSARSSRRILSIFDSIMTYLLLFVKGIIEWSAVHFGCGLGCFWFLPCQFGSPRESRVCRQGRFATCLFCQRLPAMREVESRRRSAGAALTVAFPAVAGRDPRATMGKMPCHEGRYSQLSLPNRTTLPLL